MPSSLSGRGANISCFTPCPLIDPQGLPSGSHTPLAAESEQIRRKLLKLVFAGLEKITRPLLSAPGTAPALGLVREVLRSSQSAWLLT